MYFLGDFMTGYVPLKIYMGENFQDYSWIQDFEVSLKMLN